jgi:hypothetical protein
MVEENEIRAGISFYERARLAAEAAKLGIYPDAAAAIAALFTSASPAKRSKIGSFVRVHEALGHALRYPAAIPNGWALRWPRRSTGTGRRLRGWRRRSTRPCRPTAGRSARCWKRRCRGARKQALNRRTGSKNRARSSRA